jgi:hypothetical protein
VLVPSWTGDPAQPPALAEFRPGNELLARVAADLDERRILGTRLIVSPPHYQWVSAEVAVRLQPGADARRIGRDAVATLYSYLHPLRGGPDGQGWPFGRSVTSGELLGVLQRALGVETPEAVRLYRIDPTTRARTSGWTNKVELGPGALPFALDHTMVPA